MWCFCRAKQNSLVGLHSRGELGGELLRVFSKSWICYNSGMTSEEIFAMLQSNPIAIKFGTAAAEVK